jgi:hypothetical protein
MGEAMYTQIFDSNPIGNLIIENTDATSLSQKYLKGVTFSNPSIEDAKTM